MRIVSQVYSLSAVALLCGCSYPHPLQDDVTDLPLAHVVRKVSCEAKNAFAEILEEHRLSTTRTQYKSGVLSLKRLVKRLSLDGETKKLAATREQLDLSQAANNAETEYVRSALSALGSKPVPKELADRQARAISTSVKVARAIADYAQAVKVHNAKFDAASKQITKAKGKQNNTFKALGWFYGHQLAYSFRFRIIETDAIAAGLNWKIPFFVNGNVSSATPIAALADTKQRESDRNVKLVMSLEDLHGLDCSTVAVDASPLRRLHYPITGSIGVAEVIRQYFALLEQAKFDEEHDGGLQDDDHPRVVFAKTDAYTDTILFTTTLSGSVAPTIALNPTLKEAVSGSVSASGTRVDYHSVLISLSRIEPDQAKAQVQKVIIVTNDALSPK